MPAMWEAFVRTATLTLAGLHEARRKVRACALNPACSIVAKIAGTLGTKTVEITPPIFSQIAICRIALAVPELNRLCRSPQAMNA